MEQNLVQNVDTLFTNMENFAQHEGLIGKPVTQGDKTFLPVLSVTIGYGGGNTQSKNQQGNAVGSINGSGSGNMEGGALGLGAKLSTDAVIIINKDDVTMVPLNAGSGVTQMIDKLPQIITGMNGGQSASQNTQQNSQQNAQAQAQTPTSK